MATDAGRAVLVAHQPAYLPWCGYFSRLLDVRRMVILDHVQFSTSGYQHRNRILDRSGTPRWLTVPIRRRFGQPLHNVRIADPAWAPRHWRILTDTYAKAPYWSNYADQLGALIATPWTMLVDLDLALTRFLLAALDIHTTLARSTTIRPAGSRTAMLIDLCQRTGNQVLRVGTSGPKYLDQAALQQAGIAVEVATYTHPPTAHRYPGPATSPLSIVDLLAHHGPTARDILAAGSTITTWPSA